MAIPITSMVPGTMYQVTYLGSDARVLSVMAQHVATVGLTQLTLLSKSGTMTVDQPGVSLVVLGSPPPGDPS